MNRNDRIHIVSAEPDEYDPESTGHPSYGPRYTTNPHAYPQPAYGPGYTASPYPYAQPAYGPGYTASPYPYAQPAYGPEYTASPYPYAQPEGPPPPRVPTPPPTHARSRARTPPPSHSRTHDDRRTSRKSEPKDSRTHKSKSKRESSRPPPAPNTSSPRGASHEHRDSARGSTAPPRTWSPPPRHQSRAESPPPRIITASPNRRARNRAESPPPRIITASPSRRARSPPSTPAKSRARTPPPRDGHRTSRESKPRAYRTHTKDETNQPGYAPDTDSSRNKGLWALHLKYMGRCNVTSCEVPGFPYGRMARMRNYCDQASTLDVNSKRFEQDMLDMEIEFVREYIGGLSDAKQNARGMNPELEAEIDKLIVSANQTKESLRKHGLAFFLQTSTSAN